MACSRVGIASTACRFKTVDLLWEWSRVGEFSGPVASLSSHEVIFHFSFSFFRQFDEAIKGGVSSSLSSRSNTRSGSRLTMPFFSLLCSHSVCQDSDLAPSAVVSSGPRRIVGAPIICVSEMPYGPTGRSNSESCHSHYGSVAAYITCFDFVPLH